MRGRLLAIISFLIISLSLTAQDKLHTRSKKAIALYQQARELDHAGNWYRSLDLLKQALAKDDSFDEAILLTHQIFIKRGDWFRADSIFNKHEPEVEKSFKNRMLLDGAFYNYSEGDYERAAELKNRIDERVTDIDSKLYDLVIASIDYSLEKKAEARNIEFRQLKGPLNNHPQQYFPSITADSTLVFTVREKEGRGHEDIFFSQATADGWTHPESISKNINTGRNEGTASISADGRTLVFTGCNKPGGVGSCDLYISYKEGGQWSKPQLLSREVNSLYWESQPSLSQDGRQLYFVSKRPDGLGGQDIWWSKKVRGVWQPAVNLGPDINTSFDDCSPYIHPNGKTMFFASRGRPGFGGYDLYRSERMNDVNWTAPVNLGYPINTHQNQVGYTISADGWAYYSDNSSNRETRLFKFKVPEDLLPEAPVFSLAGLIRDADTDEPLAAQVIVADLATDSTLVATQSDLTEGEFRLLMERNDNAYVYIKKKGYLLFKAGMKELYENNNEAEIQLKPLGIGDRVVLNNILFEFNSATLDEKATKELELAAAFILENPEVKVEIGGHTDSQGEESYNIELSKSRAASVYQFFLRKNVPKDNLEFVGYGESQPVTDQKGNSTAALNRRIELVIVDLLK